MKRIKKVLLLMLAMSMCSLLLGQSLAFAREKVQYGAYDLSGARKSVVNVYLDKLLIKDEYVGSGIEQIEMNTNITVSDKILSIAEVGENFIYMDMKTDDLKNPYSEIEPTYVTVMLSNGTGNIRKMIGKDYRLYYAENADAEFVDISDKITDTSETRPKFALEKLGIYVLCFNPKVYNATFYLEEPVYEGGIWINQDCIYEQITDLDYEDTIQFPKTPEKAGYVFTGWKAQHFTGGGYGNPIKYPIPQPIKISFHKEFYATWNKEEEYVPIELMLYAENRVIKGKENGTKCLLKTNYGIFSENITWTENWKIVGNDELAVENVEIVDDKTVELTLSGNSSDIYTESEINVEFLYNLLLPEPVVYEGELVTDYHTKIKMDEDGVMAEWYRSDNAITLERQKRVNSGSGGGGGSTANYTVTFADGESKETVKVKQNKAVSEPEVPEKEGYVFDGWYLDEKYTVAYDFSAKVTRNFTLYAKWDKAEESQIILTVGEKEAVVNGETKENDVAPMIKGDRAYLPARFVAESLGADVLWDAEAKTVTIRTDDTEIILTIGEKDAEINGETVVSDAEPFLENDRTYTHIRLIAEALGAKVEWDEETKNITITK